MGVHPTLQEHLEQWCGRDEKKHAVGETVRNLARAGSELAGIVDLGPIAGDMGAKRGELSHGDTQKELDALSHGMIADALKASPVAWMGSEEDDGPVEINAGAPLAVNVDPLDGSSNIEANVSIGTIFSILPAEGPDPLLQPGRKQIAAGYIVYGPQTAMVLSLGHGTNIFWLNPQLGEFALAKPDVKIPAETQEYAVNASNYRHWDEAIKAYITDCNLGAEGPRKTDFNMRWVGSLVADAFRIFMRGGIFLYPGDKRKGYAHGRLRLLYEANPIAMLMEQAGGAASTGRAAILDIQPQSLHQRTPLISGSKSEVEKVFQYYSKMA